MTDRRRAFGAAALAGECERIRSTSTGRHKRLYASARSMGELVGAGQLDAETARAALVEAGLATGLGAGDVRRTVRDGLAKGAAQPRDLSHLDLPSSRRSVSPLSGFRRLASGAVDTGQRAVDSLQAVLDRARSIAAGQAAETAGAPTPALPPGAAPGPAAAPEEAPEPPPEVGEVAQGEDPPEMDPPAPPAGGEWLWEPDEEAECPPGGFADVRPYVPEDLPGVRPWWLFTAEDADQLREWFKDAPASVEGWPAQVLDVQPGPHLGSPLRVYVRLFINGKAWDRWEPLYLVNMFEVRRG